MDDTINGLYDIILKRKNEPQEGSYTCYLFEKGIDKILKKVGEECAETIIAAKNGDSNETVMEICDLFYHTLVLCAQMNIPVEALTEELEKRRLRQGNLKPVRDTDKDS